MTTAGIYQEYEIKIDNLSYKYRQEILERIWDYLNITYHNDINHPTNNHHAIINAIQLIRDRYSYKHHATLGF